MVVTEGGVRQASDLLGLEFFTSTSVIAQDITLGSDVETIATPLRRTIFGA